MYKMKNLKAEIKKLDFQLEDVNIDFDNMDYWINPIDGRVSFFLGGLTLTNDMAKHAREQAEKLINKHIEEKNLAKEDKDNLQDSVSDYVSEDIAMEFMKLESELWDMLREEVKLTIEDYLQARVFEMEEQELEEFYEENNGDTTTVSGYVYYEPTTNNLVFYEEEYLGESERVRELAWVHELEYAIHEG